MKPPPQAGSLPPEDLRCTDVFSDTLQGYSGIQAVEYDYDSGSLKAVYDPRLLNSQEALHVIRKAGRRASARVAQCASRRERGASACQQCSAALTARLAQQYEAAAALPHADFRDNTIEISLGTSRLDRMEDAEVHSQAAAPASPAQERPLALKGSLEVVLTVINALTGLLAFLLETWRGGAPWVTLLYAISYAAGGWFGLKASLAGLREKTLNVDLLMILAALGAALIGHPAEGAMLLFLFSLSNTLQSFAMDRSRKAIEALLDLRPAQATVRRGSRLVLLPVEKLALADVVLVRPGERFPIDGEVAVGQSDVDQATITGESMPVHKEAGDFVFAGTLNGNGSLEIRVTRLARDTTLARIVKMVEEAQAAKANTQRMLDSFEQRYAVFILVACALLIVIPPLLLGHDFEQSFYRAMTWLVVASPCALVISTPASILSAIANGARHGILFKGGVHLEKAATIKVIAFDKTGTLTTGSPQLTAVLPLAGQDENELLRLSAALESRSEHPLARAIVGAAHARSIELPNSAHFRSMPGQGVEGSIEGRLLWIGNERLFDERGVHVGSELQSSLADLHNAGQTVMLVYEPASARFLGLLAVADAVREDAADAIRRLKQAGVDRVVMLTGDNPQVAAGIAARLGVDEFHSGLLPQDKVTILSKLRERYGPVAMVGDGVNDAPSLAAADIGIAMGAAGTDVAVETADIVLMSDDLKKIPFTLGLARQARQVVWQNLSFAMLVIVVLIASAFGAHLPLPLGVVGHEGSTVVVVLNGLRLLGYRAPL